MRDLFPSGQILTGPRVSPENMVGISVNLQEEQIREDTPAVRGQDEAEPARGGGLVSRWTGAAEASRIAHFLRLRRGTEALV